MIEFLVRIDDDPVVCVGRADCARAVPAMLYEIGDAWQKYLQERDALTNSANYSGEVTAV